MNNIKKAKVKRVERIDDFDDEYVYDIGMKNENHPWFFGNDILVHNSVYFSAYKQFCNKDSEYEGFKKKGEDFEWTKDNAIALYDDIGDKVNKTFPPFMVRAFHVPEENSKVIAAGREVVGERGLFLAKKRYSILVIDDEGKRVDINGKPGKVKAMGIEIKRSDTPEFMQDFLEDMLGKVLAGSDEDTIIKMIRDFRDEFRDMKGYEIGTPKAVKNLSKYRDILARPAYSLINAQGKKITIPGHVQASLNYNQLKEFMGDKHSMPIADGSKIIVCQLKQNKFGFKNIAYPVEEANLPEWFKKLPFDDDKMEASIFDTKVKNLIGILGWDLTKTKNDTAYGDLFF